MAIRRLRLNQVGGMFDHPPSRQDPETGRKLRALEGFVGPESLLLPQQR